MKRINLLFCFLCLCAFTIKAQQNLEDVVTLKNGSIIRGTIVEQIPNKTLKIKTKDGSVFVYNISEVEKMTREEIVNNNGNQYQNQNQNQYQNQYQNGYNNQPNIYNPKYKNPGTALLWSLLIPGGGQFYNGEAGKGILMLGMSVGFDVLSAIGSSMYVYDYSSGGILLELVGLAGVIGTSIWSMVDASNSAKKLNFQNGLGLNFKLDKNTDLALQPDFKYDYYGGNKLNPIFGAKLSLSLH